MFIIKNGSTCTRVLVLHQINSCGEVEENLPPPLESIGEYNNVNIEQKRLRKKEKNNQK